MYILMQISASHVYNATVGEGIKQRTDMPVTVVCNPPFCRRGWASNQIFENGGLNRNTTFRGEFWEREG